MSDETGALDGSRVVHDEAVRRAVGDRAAPGELARLAETFQMLSNPTRLRIVDVLATREMCVQDLAAVVGASPSAVSHHLRQLRQMQIVRCRREGRRAYYRLDDEHVASLYAIGRAHVREERGEART